MSAVLERGDVEFDDVVQVSSGTRSGQPAAAGGFGGVNVYTSGSGQMGGQPIQVRKDFAETWLFDNIVK